MHRFFAPNLDPGDETVTLPKDEAEHLTRVLRLSVGDLVSVFDGRGHEFSAKVIVAQTEEGTNKPCLTLRRTTSRDRRLARTP